MSKGLATVASIRSLTEAWQRLYRHSRSRNRDTAGRDGESLNGFKEHERHNILAISERVRKGSYSFSLLTPHLVEKSTGGIRVICVPTIRDRIVQRALVDFLSERYMEGGKKARKLRNAVSYGFVRGRTVEQAIAVACAYREANPWIYKTDIASFFDRIQRADLHECIRRHITEESLHPILINASNCEVDESKRSVRAALHANNIRRGVGVRQGMPLSPLFANLLLVAFDRDLGRKRMKAVRYADDLIFFGASETECLTYHEYCKEALQALGLTVPEFGPVSKSQIFAPDAVADFLGMGIKRVGAGGAYRAVVTERQFRKMREKFLTLGDVSQLNSRRIPFARFGAVLDSTVEGYMGCYEYALNSAEVAHRLEDFREMAITRLLKDALDVDARALKPVARTFLGL
jgi:retron-type reverse transcriptase